jgi:hypothetical protein
MQPVTEIVQQLGDPSVAGRFGQAIAFFGLGAKVVKKVSRRPVTFARGAALGLLAKSVTGGNPARCPKPALKPKN